MVSKHLTYFCLVRTLRFILRISLFGSLLLTVWFSVYLCGILLSRAENKNIDLIPEDATFALRIDGEKISETTLFTVLLEAKDEEIIRLLTTTIKKRTSGEVDFKNPGINLLSDIVIFEAPFKGKQIRGVIFNLFNEQAFLNNFNKNLSSQQFCYAQGNIGVLLSVPQKSTHKKDELEIYAKHLFTQKTPSHQFNSKQIEKIHFAELHLHKALKNNNREHHEIDLSFDYKGQSFLLEGSMSNLSEFEEHFLSHHLTPKGLHFTSRIFAQEWADSLKRMLSFLPVHLPEITAFSLNYEGANVVNHSSGFFVIPQIELVVQCKDEFSIHDLFAAGSLQSELDYKLLKNELWIQNERLYFKQLTPKSFYIGVHSAPDFANAEKSVILNIKGELKPLINIKGGGLMTAFLEMLPAFKASRILTESSEGIDLQITKTTKNSCRIQGELSFKDGHYPMAEVLRFFLVGQFIE